MKVKTRVSTCESPFYLLVNSKSRQVQN